MVSTIAVVGESASQTPWPAILAAVVMLVVGLALLVCAPSLSRAYRTVVRESPAVAGQDLASSRARRDYSFRRSLVFAYVCLLPLCGMLWRVDGLRSALCDTNHLTNR